MQEGPAAFGVRRAPEQPRVQTATLRWQGDSTLCFHAVASEELQAKDRYECHTWAVSQTHYDPVQPMGGVSEARLSQLRADYRRAEDACLDGRGYTVK